MTLVNGLELETIPVRDRGLAYGDGVFRTLTIRKGRLQYWERHYAKLSADCARLALAVPDEALLRRECQLVSYVPPDCVVKIIVTRGEGARGYAISEQTHPTRIVMHSALPCYPSENQDVGIKVRLCGIRLAEQPILAGIKHLNRLENVLARAEWNDPWIAEGLLLDPYGNVIEGVMSNLFLVRRGVLITPDLSRCGVAGVTRERILDWAQQVGIATEIRAVPFDELLDADECLVCNSLIGVWQVRELENRRWGSGVLTPQIREFLAKDHDKNN